MSFTRERRFALLLFFPFFFPFLPLLFPLSLAGCGAQANASQVGNLGKGSFAYDCFSQEDVACPNNGREPFPAEIALGARFKVSFTQNDGAKPYGVPTMEPVSGDFLKSAGDAFLALKAGRVGILAMGGNGKVIDETTVNIVSITHVKVEDGSAAMTSALAMSAGESKALKAVPLGALDEPMAGLVDFAWTTSDASVVALSAQTGPRVSLVAKAAGDATIVIASGNAHASFAVTVK